MVTGSLWVPAFCFDSPKAPWMLNVAQLVGSTGVLISDLSASKAHVHNSYATLVQADLENLPRCITFIYLTGITSIYLKSVTPEIIISFTSFSSITLLVNVIDRNPIRCWQSSFLVVLGRILLFELQEANSLPWLMATSSSSKASRPEFYIALWLWLFCLPPSRTLWLH